MSRKGSKWIKLQEWLRLGPHRPVCLFSYDPEVSRRRNHCCQRMADAVDYRCGQHPDPFDCHDSLVYCESRFDEYGIIVHDGGSSYVLMDFCPFCGAKLPGSKSDLWFEKLEAMGFEDPWTDDIPREFRTDEWFRD